MKHIDAQEWNLLKKHTSSHLTDPTWLGGAFCVTQSEVHGRVHLPSAGVWDAVVLSRRVDE